MKPTVQALLLCFALLLHLTSLTAAQNIPPQDEPDSAAFIEATFQLQSSYTTVRCVSGDGTCPTTFTTAVPCFSSGCSQPEQTYPVTAVHGLLQDAIHAAQPGDLILIMPGRYAGVEVENTGGTEGAYIHLLGMGDVIVDRPGDATKAYLRHHFYFINAHHYIVENITFTGAAEGAGIFVSGYFSETGTFSHHFIFSRIYAHDNYSWGMHTTATSSVLVQDSVFTTSADEHGLYVSGSGDDMLIRRSIFQGNNASGVQINPDPQTATSELFYLLQNLTGETCGWTEADAEFTGAAQWEDLKRCYDQQGLPDLGRYIEDGIAENIIIEQNIITGNGSAGGAGINLASLRHSVVRGNLIYGNDAAGIACWDNAYAEEKGLSASQFGCQNVLIANNTIVDEGGGRGALIINRDARDMRVFNNIIVRDRADAYEIAENAGSGLHSGSNYYSAQSVTESPGFAGETASITGFTVSEALAQFVNPGFEPWIIADGTGYQLNPARPDYHLRPGSVLAAGGDGALRAAVDLFGQPRGSEIGALTVGGEPVAAITAQPTAAPQPLSPAGTVVFSMAERAYMIREGAVIELSALLDLAARGEDGYINISPNGLWILLETTRFDHECDGWSCWVLLDALHLQSPEVIRVNGEVVHAEGAAAVNAGGDLLIIEGTDGPHDVDLYAITRLPDGGWSDPVLLTADSAFPYNRQPALSNNGTQLLFDCRTEPYGGDGSTICEVGINGDGLRVVITPDARPEGFPPATMLRHADYTPDGAIVFEGDWHGEQIWILDPGSATPRRIAPQYNNDNSPCVLPDGSIVSLWLNRPEGEGIHEVKRMSADGTQEQMLLLDQDVTDIGLGCGR